MKKTAKLSVKSLLIGGIVVLSSCMSGGQEGEMSTDMINDPATAAAAAEEEVGDMPAIEFEENVIDFGEISQGEKVKRTFQFKNVGKTDLIISDAKGSCGCTVPRWPKQPIRPGQEGVIEVLFDSNGKMGRQHKTVTIIANTKPNTTVIALKGDVLTAEQ